MSSAGYFTGYSTPYGTPYFPSGPTSTGPTGPITALGPGDTFSQPTNTTRQYSIAPVDPNSGQPIPPGTYEAASGLRCFIWEGGDGPILSSPTVGWIDQSAPSIYVEVDPTHLAPLAIQPYPARVEVLLAGGWQSAWDGWVDVDYEPAAAPAIAAPGSFRDMLKFGGPAIKQLLDADSRAGFLVERGQAWTWLRGVILAKYRPFAYYPGSAFYGGALPGYWVSPDYPNPVIAGYLDSGKLLITDLILEALARKALAVLFDRQEDARWWPMASREHKRADILASSLVAGIDPVGDGYPTIAINCGTFNTRDV